MNNYPRRTFLKTTVLAAAATVTARVNAAPLTWGQNTASDRGLNHPFFAHAAKPDVIAHRGGNGQWPGETMYAMRKAHELGCDVLEMDVYRTADQQNPELVLMHNPLINDTTPGSGFVYKKRLKELTALRADNDWKRTCGPKQLDPSKTEAELHVPTLKQVLDAFPNMRIVIEMKRAPKKFSPVERLCELLTDPDRTRQVLVASFHQPFMDDFRSQLPSVATSFTLSLEDALIIGTPKIEKVIAKILSGSSQQQGPDALQLPHWIITKGVVDLARERNVVLHAWTVNTTKDMDRMIERRVDGIITDCPGVLMDRLGRS